MLDQLDLPDHGPCAYVMPCPFCGAACIWIDRVQRQHHAVVTLKCDGCPASMHAMAETVEKAERSVVEQWNERPPVAAGGTESE